MLDENEKPRSAVFRRTLLCLSVCAVAACAYGAWRIWLEITLRDTLPAHELQTSFNEDTSGLEHTQVVATLDTPIVKGKNIIWCTSFLSAWKKLQTDIAKEPVALVGEDILSSRLNNARDPSSDLPEAGSYAKAGWVNKGIIQTIQSEMKERFPNKQTPVFPGILENSFLAYAYLEAEAHFSIPYFENRKPLIFKDSVGGETEVRSFGLRPEDGHAHFDLRKQVQVCYAVADPREGEFGSNVSDFVVDLCRGSKPNQVVVARIEPKETLASTVSYVEERVLTAERQKRAQGLGPADVLLVPDVFYRVLHHFAELEGREFANRALSGQIMDVATQEIVFRLDRSGAELKSEARMFLGSIPPSYCVDRPFLVYMKKRGAKQPFFVMWVDNSELLQEWSR